MENTKFDLDVLEDALMKIKRNAAILYSAAGSLQEESPNDERMIEILTEVEENISAALEKAFEEIDNID